MERLKLDLDSLEVQSFETTAGPENRRGTVHGQMVPIDSDAYAFAATGCGDCGTGSGSGSATATCAGYYTCDASCNGTCNTCNASCGGTCDANCGSGSGDSGGSGNDTSYGYTFLVSCCPRGW
jgi:hypothetical protein